MLLTRFEHWSGPINVNAPMFPVIHSPANRSSSILLFGVLRFAASRDGCEGELSGYEKENRHGAAYFGPRGGGLVFERRGKFEQLGPRQAIAADPRDDREHGRF